MLLSKLKRAVMTAAVVIGAMASFSITAFAAVTPQAAIAKGIDVSRYQGTVNWPLVAQDGIKFAFVRIGNSKTGIDATYQVNMMGANAVGLRVGGYWYSQATTPEAAVAEANTVIGCLQNMPVSMPVVFDIEADVHKPLNPAQQQAVVAAFCNTVEAAGYYPMVYASKNWFQTRLGHTPYDQWVAQYALACDYPLPLAVWQASDKGRVAGIAGNVDIDYLYKDYSSLIIQTGWLNKKGFNYFYENWHLKKGWIDFAGAKYYTDPLGRMLTGWLDIEGTGQMRYFMPTGAMAVGIVPVENDYYFFDANGYMQTGWQSVGASKYFLGADGKMFFGRYDTPEGTYYFGADGSMQVGIVVIDGETYYFNEKGIMATGWQRIGGGEFYFDPDSGELKTGLIQDGKDFYYAGSDGQKQIGWQTIDNDMYYFGLDGKMYRDTVQIIDGGAFAFDKKGVASVADITALTN